MKLIWAGLLIISFLGCAEQNQQDTLQFNVDPGILAEKYQVDSLGFAYSPPAGWQIDSLKSTDLAVQQFQNELLHDYTIKILEIFYDRSSASFCSVSLIQSAVTADLNYFVSHFGNILSEQMSNENLKQGLFIRADMNINQFLIMSDTKVIFKLFFQPTDSHIIQLDYAIDRTIYPNYIKKVESSIGSITPIN